ncbi:MAG: hypothetical protein FWB90_03580 [Fibromonadales bacterium]|nr:hypothetical protein [Fibromonadales bacterium]
MKMWFAILLAFVFLIAPTTVFADDDGADRWGLYIGFGGSSDAIGVAYDFGTGLQLGLGLGFNSWMPDNGNSTTRFMFRPLMLYSLGKDLLGYGLGVRASIERYSVEGNDNSETNISVTPNFYVSAPLVSNVALSVNAGLQIDMPDNGLRFSTVMSGLLVFYFL